MSITDDLIDFSIIETQKENIQSLPHGRSAKALVSIFSPSPLTHSEPTLNDTKTLNDAIRNEYEIELRSIGESDDPLDIYDRYVKWTLNAYPSAQATPQSQLLPLLERATKAFISSAHYKNDPRYLKLWLNYIRFFSDSPRETFAFLARHAVGDGLALFYEEFAAWLEGAGRWAQAEEVYTLGIEKEARPQERLLRKFGEFRSRAEQRSQSVDDPSSPALPTIRPALAAKLDPWATAGSTSTPRATETQLQRPTTAAGGTRSGRQKLAIFSDTDGMAGGSEETGTSKGWENIGSLQDRRKENTVEPKPWAGETLKVGKTAGAVQKMEIFRDQSSNLSPIVTTIPNPIPNPHPNQEVVNPKTKKVERVFVNLEAVYPDINNASLELSFEELRATRRGWMDKDWSKQRKAVLEEISTNVQNRDATTDSKSEETVDGDLSSQLQENLVLEDSASQEVDTSQQKEGSREGRGGRTKKIRVREIKQETQTIKTNLESPTGRKLRRKNSSEPTMTLHTKAATDEIYSIFNQPLKSEQKDNTESGCDSDYEDDDCTSAGDSTGTGRISGTTSEFGEDETNEIEPTGEDETEAASVGEWTEFSSSKHVPKLDADGIEETTDAGLKIRPTLDLTGSREASSDPVEELITPISAMEVSPLKSKFIPLPPEDYEPPRRTYRDEAVMAQNRLPFMTPIVEKTETSITRTEEREYFNSKTPSAENVLIDLKDERSDDEDVTFVKKEKYLLDVTKPQSQIKPNKTPRPQHHAVDGNLLSSPFQAIVGTHSPVRSISRKASSDVVSSSPSKKIKPSRRLVEPKPLVPKFETKAALQKGPIIKDSCCNPVDETVRQTICQNLQPPLAKYDGYFDHGSENSGRRSEIEKHSNAVAKMKRSTSDKTMTVSIPPILRFGGADKIFAVKKCLGKGAFGAVYLAEKLESDDNLSTTTEDRSDSEPPQPSKMNKGEFALHPRTKPLEAIKMEDVPNAWEFYILCTAHRRLGISRAAESIVHAYEMHVFHDESFLVEEYRDQGTLLDLINIHKEDAAKGLASVGVMDESLAMFFTIELFRTMEALHAKGVLHGDLKVDNCLIRFDAIPKSVNNGELSFSYFSDGQYGWSQKGLSLIDFGRGIDIRCFTPNVGFIADWQTRAEDCPEMRELRPWTYQIDYYGLANIVHLMLFGKDISTMVDKSAEATIGGVGIGATKWYKLREPLKRYWQGDIWGDIFDLLLNPLRLTTLNGEEGMKLPVLKGMRRCRERMESYLAGEGERRGLRSNILKLEGRVKERSWKGK